MKTSPTTVTWLLFTLLLLHGQGIAEQKGNVYRSSLTVNGQPLDSDTLAFTSRGVLALVEGDLHWSKRQAMPYQSLLKLGGSAQQQDPAINKAVVRQAEIWPSAWLYTVVVDPEPSKHKPVLFRVSLRRGGTVLRQWPTNPKEHVYSVQLDDVWRYARLGDELVVEPLTSATLQPVVNQGKRVLKLEKLNRPMVDGC